MKSFTRAISNIIKSQPYQSGRYFDKDNIMTLNELGDTFYCDKTTYDCTLRVNGISTLLPAGAEMSDEMFTSMNGQLINQKILLLNSALEGEIHVTALSVTEEWGGEINPNNMFNFTGTKPTLLLDDRYSANNEVDAVVFYCIEKNGRYYLAKRLFSENFDKEHLLFSIDKELYESPDRISFSFNTEYSGMYHIKKDDAVVTPPGPIACIPSTFSFLNKPVNYNLVSRADYIYEFYAIVVTSAQRFFVRTSGNAVPTEPVIGNIYDDNDNLIMENADLTAGIAVDAILNRYGTETSGFNEDFYGIRPNDPYIRFLDRLWYRYDTKPTQTPQESWSFTKLDGYTVTSTFPDDYTEDAEDLDLRFYPDPYSFKFARATIDEVQRYGIVNNNSQRCINIIDYINGGNEMEAFSCAQMGLPTSPDHDDVSLINCVEAPSEYDFGLQSMHSLSDTSGTIQITDTVSGLTKKYLFKQLGDFLTSQSAIDFIQLDFPAYQSSSWSSVDKWTIMANIPARFSEPNDGALKIIIQMNASNALFYNNGANRLAFCLNVFRYSDL